MITVKYETDGREHSLTMEGHANYADHGDDIVCAGASSIVFALLGWLENNGQDQEFNSCEVESGNVRIYCEGGARTAAAFEMTVIGLAQLADSYPDHVAIETTGLAG